MHTHAVRASLEAVFPLHGMHASVSEPETEYVPATQASTTALAVVEHCVVMRLPAEVGVHVLGHSDFGALMPVP